MFYHPGMKLSCVKASSHVEEYGLGGRLVLVSDLPYFCQVTRTNLYQTETRDRPCDIEIKDQNHRRMDMELIRLCFTQKPDLLDEDVRIMRSSKWVSE